MTEAEVLADTLDKTRALTKFYLSSLKEVNPEEPIIVNGENLNSLYWICAHLLWAEDNLAIKMTGGTSIAPEWAKHFPIKSSGELPAERPDFKTVLAEMKKVHEASIQHIKTLSSEQLNEENPAGFHFGDGNTTKRMMLQHCIRHEGTHLGQISLIARIFGKKLI